MEEEEEEEEEEKEKEKKKKKKKKKELYFLGRHLVLSLAAGALAPGAHCTPIF